MACEEEKSQIVSDFVFDVPLYVAARQSRLRNLFRHLDLTRLSGKRILEPGCGTGELGQPFVEAGCQVVSIDARPEYIKEVHRRFPGREAYVVDLEHWDHSPLGHFDAVFCFGVFYHLSNPAAFLAACARIAPELYLETVVSDSDKPACPLVDENGPDQAVSGRGCRPSPAWIYQALGSMGFVVRDISTAEANWYGDSPSVFDWTPLNDDNFKRGDALIRKMFLCHRDPRG
jgi:SAM-dependent methyltransferase